MNLIETYFYYFDYMCMYVSVRMHISAGARTIQKMVPDPRLLELLLFGSQLAWVLKTKLRYPAMTVHVLNCWAIYIALLLEIKICDFWLLWFKIFNYVIWLIFICIIYFLFYVWPTQIYKHCIMEMHHLPYFILKWFKFLYILFYVN